MKEEQVEARVSKVLVAGRRKTNMKCMADLEASLEQIELEASLRHSRGNVE